MVKKFLLSLCCLLGTLGIASAQDWTVDFTKGTKGFPETGSRTETTVTFDGKTFKVYDVKGYSNYLMVNKSGGYIILPPMTFASKEITVVTGTGASTAVTVALCVGDTQIVNKTLSAKNTSFTYQIPEQYKAAGTEYKLLVTNNKNAQFQSITVIADNGAPVLETVATPTFTPASGTVLNDENNTVTISCATAGATIHYTTDGTAPTAESAVYTAPIVLTDAATVKAIATKDGMNVSAVASATYRWEAAGAEKVVYTLVTNASDLKNSEIYIIAAAGYDYALGNATKNNNRPAVEITKVNDQIVNPADDVALIQLEAAGTEWKFKVTNGNLAGKYLTNPSKSSNYLTGVAAEDSHSATIEISETGVATILFSENTEKNLMRFNNGTNKLFSCYGSGQEDIALYKQTTAVAAKVATPVITADEDGHVTITCATEGAKIYYTTNGTEPSATSTLYTNTFTVPATTTVKAIAYVGTDASTVSTKEVVVTETITLAQFLEQKPAQKARVKGPLTVIYQAGSNLYLTDGEGNFILCFGKINYTDLVNGNTLAYVEGTYNDYNGLPELNISAAGAKGDDVDKVEPAELTSVANIADQGLNTYVILKGVKISDINGQNATLTDREGNTYTCRLNKSIIAAYPGDIEPDWYYWITGFTSVYNSSYQFTPINIISEYTATGIEAIEAEAAAAANTTWFNLQGQRVSQPVRGGIYLKVNAGKAVKVRY